MRITLFDWTTGGHHARYIHRFSEALGDFADVALAVPDEIAQGFRDASAEVYRLGRPRPALDLSRPAGRQHRVLALAELALFERVAHETRPDHIVHLYADPVIRHLINRPCLPMPCSVCVFFPRAHYPRVYGSRLKPKERVRGWFQRYVQARWRRRRDAHLMFFLDEEAARGLPHAQWLPEPPVVAPPPAMDREERAGCIHYGVLARRKGIDLLTAAVSLAPLPARVTLAGAVEAGFETELDVLVGRMRGSGTEVDLRAHRHDEAEGLVALSAAACAVLPYPEHYGMSRVLVEAATVRTPVVVHDWGLLGHLVRQHGLGLAVDCREPQGLRAAILSLTEGEAPWVRFSDNLARFADRYSRTRFEEALRRAFRPVPDVSEAPAIPRPESVRSSLT